jgi:hypothetical protein
MLKQVKRLSLLIVMLTSSVAVAQNTTNAIYIEQVGDSSTIAVTQEGDGNQLGSAASDFNLVGDNQIVSILQNGPRNIMNGYIRKGDNVTFNASQIGFDNIANINLGNTGSVAGTTFNLGIYGDGNVTNFTQGAVASSRDAVLNYTITGHLNELTSNIEANDVVNTVAVTGNFNTINTLQNGYMGKNIDMNLLGSFNNISINQTSLSNVDTLVLDSTSSNSTITINQCNGGGC